MGTGSTTWGWRKVKITEPPAGPTENGGGAASLRNRPRMDRRQWLSIKVRYRGGSEAWWWIKARGVEIKRPGHLALHDVLSEIYEGGGGSTT